VGQWRRQDLKTPAPASTNLHLLTATSSSFSIYTIIFPRPGFFPTCPRKSLLSLLPLANRPQAKARLKITNVTSRSSQLRSCPITAAFGPGTAPKKTLPWPEPSIESVNAEHWGQLCASRSTRPILLVCVCSWELGAAVSDPLRLSSSRALLCPSWNSLDSCTFEGANVSDKVLGVLVGPSSCVDAVCVSGRPDGCTGN